MGGTETSAKGLVKSPTTIRRGEVRHHLFLLISILLLFIVGPLVDDLPQGVLLMNILGVVVLAAGLYALHTRRSLFTAAIVLSVVSVAGTVLVNQTQQKWAAAFSYSCVIALVIFFALTILAYVMQGSAVTTDKIYAAICVYLLMGFAWAFAFALLDAVQPGSFTFRGTNLPTPYMLEVPELRYFSFMTLTTVGYGDITPATTTARTLAALEAIAGQMYLTVLVARLVGLHIVHSNPPRTRDE